MDIIEFQQQAQSDPDLRAFLAEVATAIPADEDGAGQRFVNISAGPSDAAVMLAAYVVYRYFKHQFDVYCATKETEIAERRAKLIQELAGEKFPKEKAETIVTALLNNLAKRTDNDPAIAQARKLIGK